MIKNVIPPGAYYNPSSVSTIGLSVMVTLGCNAEKTIELMGFTVEERRLIGSRQIALKYIINTKHVTGMLNSDMVGYKGFGICKAKDKMSNPEQSSWLVELMNRYLNRLQRRL